ncbi:SDR family NAD(P)-dependent oxidoreductase [Pseudoteredinibacter isoporae]|uniref:NAD(P)-dependent dehydrogenase (Short-subunit alcohol dehydrogenase family) n=1 Tax=Pseudoteredinibacter isoporae TaxID=570281 RepID=A0A7X0MX88_9GAMM|nr:SDR family NAD(P)-dependent oxidoreductase [Pseudoteredinibacter isoporae]MBB6520637.1 NAD(P)-dependent dehydrogenase (short-subunit alcohol dehydrogenase family) [Pseudoteredinibacter isoporae]NHO86204.1 SDR family NAD(P)-dependent oxidoreductase [Pseudoteredinibacter isoporae]NIB25345.1 SDR family NAD(P)-dependent oxidoreductase [Pseudoteredinibacter isoporae]
MDTAVIAGVGAERGLGAQLCLRFASLGMHVLVAGRTQEKLDVIVEKIAEAGGSAEAVQTDVTQEADIQALFSKVNGKLTLAIYNAGNNTPGAIQDMTADYFEASWRVACFGAFLFAREASRIMSEQGSGTILFTGASASLRGKANFGAFTAAKAGLRQMAQALAKECGPQGIHVAHVIVDGAINGERVAKRYPEYAARLQEDGINLEGIVDAYQYLFEQQNKAWSFELDLRTSTENW